MLVSIEFGENHKRSTVYVPKVKQLTRLLRIEKKTHLGGYRIARKMDEIQLSKRNN